MSLIFDGKNTRLRYTVIILAEKQRRRVLLKMHIKK